MGIVTILNIAIIMMIHGGMGALIGGGMKGGGGGGGGWVDGVGSPQNGDG